MNVVRHDEPRLHPVVASISFKNNLLNEFRHVATAKPALAVTPIQPRFKPLALRGIFWLAQNRFPFDAARHRKGIL